LGASFLSIFSEGRAGIAGISIHPGQHFPLRII
jgi:hypothetical protein